MLGYAIALVIQWLCQRLYSLSLTSLTVEEECEEKVARWKTGVTFTVFFLLALRLSRMPPTNDLAGTERHRAGGSLISQPPVSVPLLPLLSAACLSDCQAVIETST